MTILRSVVYVSDATRAMSVADLDLLLETARFENRNNGISGVLLYNAGNFMQCFEGPADAVESTYARIARSRQHHNLFELMNGEVAQRSFQGWEMALARPTASEQLAISTARWTSQAGDGTAGSEGWVLLQTFWRNRRR